MQLSTGAAFVLARLQARGYRGWAVGGCVRDSLRGVPPQDFDIATDALPQQTLAAFADRTVVETGLRHGTVTVVVGRENVEVTTLRTEQGYSDGRRPDGVTFVGELAADLARRDFTINAMAWRPAEGLCDPFGGQADLAAGVIRCVGDPAVRFGEDSLRILRGLRFAAVLGFAIHPQTARAMADLAPTLGRVSAERIWVELQKLLAGAAAPEIVAQYRNILAVILPGIIPNSGEIRQLLTLLPSRPLLRLAALLGPGMENARRTALSLKTDRASRQTLAALCGLLAQPWPGEPAKAAAQLVRLWDCHRPGQLAVGGQELAGLGIPAGAPMGRLQRRLVEAVGRGEVDNTPAELLVFTENLWYNE